jgi:tetratricopeptide (TPR) repeat protein
VIALIDDLHWADNDSMTLLSELLREPGAPRVLLLCTQRTQAPASSAKVFARDVEERTLELANLSQGAAIALVEQLAQHGPHAPLDSVQLARESGGHPLFLRELLEATQQGAATAGEITLDGVIGERIAKLAPDPKRLLYLLAISGAPVEASVLREASGLGGSEFSDALHSLRAARLVHAAGEIFDDRLDISHDRLRRVVRAGLLQADVEALHRLLASALELRGDPVLSAAHWREAQHPERAAQHYASAGRLALEALAFGDAASHYRAALSLGKWQGGERMSLLSALGDALSNAGKGAEAAQHYRLAALAGGDPATTDAVELKRRAAEELVRSGYLDEGLKVAREVLEEADLKPAKSPLSALLVQRSLLRLRGLRFRERKPDEISPKELARIDLCWSMSSGLVLTDTFLGAYFLARGLSLSLRAGEPYRVARSIAAEAAYNASRGKRHLARTRALLDMAERLSDHTKDPRAAGTVLLMRGIAAHFHGDFSVGKSLLHRASAVFREQCTGMFWERDAARQFWMECLFYLGDLKTLLSTVQTGLREADERGAIYTATNLRTGLANATWLIQAEPEAAREALTQAMSHWSVQGFHVQHWYALIGEAHLCLYEGRDEDARELMERRWGELSRSHLLRVNHTRVVAQHLRARVTLAAALSGPSARRSEGLESARRDARQLEQREHGWARLLAELLELGVRAASGDRPTEQRVLALVERLESAHLGIYALALRCVALGQAEPLSAEGVRDPGTFARMLVPGFG